MNECLTLTELQAAVEKQESINIAGHLYIGVSFDKRHTWKSHITHEEGKSRQKLTIMCKLAGTNCGD